MSESSGSEATTVAAAGVGDIVDEAWRVGVGAVL